MEYKGNALEKIDDARQTIEMIQRILQTGTLSTEELIRRLQIVQQDLENAKMYIGYI